MWSWLFVLFTASLAVLADVALSEQDAVAWRSLPEAFDQAAQADVPVVLYVHASWCGPCRRMERDVFPQSAPLLTRFARARLDFDDHDARLEVGGVWQSPAAWARHFGAHTTPAFVLFTPDGTVITQTTGFLDADRFNLLLAYVATGAYRHASFEQYVREVSQTP